ncbi:MAG: hypothetical protein HYY79_04765 [Betaproteobacteria bacterium]|nr:hypothetical protein [Betaproteobacteria bacterium]
MSATAMIGPAAAQQTAAGYPAKPVRLLVGYAPGASTDTVARIIAQKLTERWGVQVVVDNRPGANTIIASDIAAKAPADGHTLLLGNSANATNPAVYATLPYDVPTIAEQGFPGLVSDYWLGIMGPAGLPRQVIEKINKDVNTVLTLRDVREMFARSGIAPGGGSAQEMDKYFKDELAMWAAVVRDAGLDRLQM